MQGFFRLGAERGTSASGDAIEVIPQTKRRAQLPTQAYPITASTAGMKSSHDVVLLFYEERKLTKPHMYRWHFCLGSLSEKPDIWDVLSHRSAQGFFRLGAERGTSASGDAIEVIPQTKRRAQLPTQAYPITASTAGMESSHDVVLLLFTRKAS